VDSPVKQHDQDCVRAVLFVWLHMPVCLNGANSEMLLVPLYRCSFSVELSYLNECCNHLEGGSLINFSVSAISCCYNKICAFQNKI
jgi:hypothetical protein